MKQEYRNSLRTKRMIRTAFAELIGEKKTISNISVAELSERADIAKSTFYNHYEDIYAVADELFRELIESLNFVIDAMVADKTNDYRAYLDRIFDFIKENEEIYRKVSTSPDAILFIGKIKSIISKKIFANARFLPKKQTKAEKCVYMHFITNACVDTMLSYLQGDIDMPFDDMKSSVLSLIDKMVQ